MIYESYSTICLFNENWGVWKGDQSTSQLSRLMESFAQLSRSVGGGRVTKLVFAPSAMEYKRTQIRIDTLGKGKPSSLSPFKSGSGTYKAHGSSGKQLEEIEPLMALLYSSGQSEEKLDASDSMLKIQITGVIFVERGFPENVALEFLKNIVENFKSTFAKKIEALKSKFIEAKKDSEFCYSEEEFLGQFSSFSDVFRRMHKELLC